MIHRDVKEVVYWGEKGERLDRFLARQFADLTRSQVKRLIDGGWVRVNDRTAKAASGLQPGDRIHAIIPPSPPSELQPQPLPLAIIFEDNHLLVLNKPAGMVVHPGPGHASSTLVNALLAHSPGIATVGGAQRAGLVHRLDKDTSGIMVVAKTDRAHRHLTRQFKERRVVKEYIALVHGRVGEVCGTVSLSLGRDQSDRKRISTRTRKPREAITHWRSVHRFRSCTLLAVRPVTGRTHQIRVHLAAVHHPVVGDPLYRRHKRDSSKILPGLKRQFLHAFRLSFIHPETERSGVYLAPLPRDLSGALESMGLSSRQLLDKLKEIALK
jgi:23S rRNA pseudouridine1911/1915/1917 synthase